MPVRWDLSTALNPPVELPSGWLRVDARLTRTGIFEYLESDGKTIRRELRLPEEVFAKEALDSFSMVPVTNNHPPGLLDKSNTKQYQCGHAGELIKKDGDFVAGTLLITDGRAIDDMKRGKVQISCGYDCELEMTSGELDGLKYDCIQRKIRGNHIAIVDEGRAGPNVKIKMDSKGARMVKTGSTKGKKDAMETIEIVINGKTYRVPADVAAQMESMAEEAQAQIEQTADKDAPKPAPTPAPEAKGDQALRDELARTRSERDKLKARDDARSSAQSAAVQKAREDKIREDAMKAARQRVQLEGTIARILGAGFKFDGKTDLDLQKAVIVHFNPDLKLDGQSEEYIKARYDIALESAPNDSLAQAREVADGNTGSNADAGDDEPDAAQARADMHARQKKRGIAPLTFGTTKKPGE